MSNALKIIPRLSLYLLMISLVLTIVGCGTPTQSDLKNAIDKGDASKVKSLIADGVSLNPERDFKPIEYAIKKGNLDIFKVFIENGVDINKDALLSMAIDRKQYEIANYLIEKKADIDKADSSGYTPLISAVKNGDLEWTKKIISLGANINAKDKYGNSAWVYAKFNKYEELASILQQNGAEILTAQLAKEIENEKKLKAKIEKDHAALNKEIQGNSTAQTTPVDNKSGVKQNQTPAIANHPNKATLADVIGQPDVYLAKEVVVGPVVLVYNDIPNACFWAHGYNLKTKQGNTSTRFDLFYGQMDNIAKWRNMDVSEYNKNIAYVRGKVTGYGDITGRPTIIANEIVFVNP